MRSYSVMAAWQAVDTGIWPEPLGEEANKFRLPRITMTHVAALQHRGDAEKLASAVSNMRLDAEQMVPLLARTAPDDRTTMPWVERAVAQVDALLMLASGDTDAGIRALYEAARAESALPVVFGPPAIAKPSWELLGEELLALGRKADAAEAFRLSLEFAPGRKLSLEGLARAEGG